VQNTNDTATVHHSYCRNSRDANCDGVFVLHLHINKDVTYNEDFLDVSPTPNIAQMIESRRMRRVGHVALRGTERNTKKNFW
jgi:hypothetical protein